MQAAGVPGLYESQVGGRVVWDLNPAAVVVVCVEMRAELVFLEEGGKGRVRIEPAE